MIGYVLIYNISLYHIINDWAAWNDAVSIKPVLKFVNCLYAYCSEYNNLTFCFGGSGTPGTPSGSAIVMHASFVSSDQWYLKELIIINYYNCCNYM